MHVGVYLTSVPSSLSLDIEIRTLFYNCLFSGFLSMARQFRIAFRHINQRMKINYLR